MNDFLVKKPKHHSPSSINQFITNRAQWFAQRIRGLRFTAGVAAWRGTAVEAGMNFYINNGDPESDEDFSENPNVTIEECIKYALKIFTRESAGNSQAYNYLDIRQSIGPCVKTGIESFQERSYIERGIELQRQVSGIKLPGCNIPIYGKLDYVIGDKKVVDNKVVAKTPSSLKQDYMLQGAIYQYATQLPVEFHFIVPLKKEIKIKEIVVTDEDYKQGIILASKAAQAIERIFENIDSIDPDVIEDLCFPDPDGFYSIEESKAICNDVFGIGYNPPIRKKDDD